MKASEQYHNAYLYRRIVQAKLFIENNYEKPININLIADEAFFSKFHFIRLFKNTYAYTPHQFLTYIRIEKAKELLKGDSMSIGDICLFVGFDSISSFTGLFKRNTGLTPSAYRQQQLQRSEEIKQAPLKFIPGCMAEKAGWNQNSNF